MSIGFTLLQVIKENQSFQYPHVKIPKILD